MRTNVHRRLASTAEVSDDQLTSGGVLLSQSGYKLSDPLFPSERS